jgi:glycosyltransferase involved in cell wall biosynthesis
MKILFLSDTFPPLGAGGADTVAFNLAKGLKGQGHEIFVISTKQEKEVPSITEFEGLKIFRIYVKYHERWRAYLSICNPKISAEIKKIICEIEPDVVHAHNIHQYLSYNSLKIAKNCGAKVFLTAHDVMLFNYGKMFPSSETQKSKSIEELKNISYKINFWNLIKQAKKRYNPLRNIIIRHYLKYVDKIFAVSNFIKKALNDNSIDNVEVVYNGIDLDLNEKISESEKVNFIEKYNLKNSKIILFGGRISTAKGAFQIIKSLPQIVKSISNVKLLVAGNKNNYTQNLVKMAEDLGVKNRIIFTGWLNKKNMSIVNIIADVCAMPSIYFEPFGMMALEAMMSRKPVVAGFYGGLSEVVDDGKTGYLINPFNIDDLASKIILLLQDEKKSQQMGALGFDRAKKFFSLENQIKKTLEHYSRVGTV